MTNEEQGGNGSHSNIDQLGRDAGDDPETPEPAAVPDGVRVVIETGVLISEIRRRAMAGGDDVIPSAILDPLPVLRAMEKAIEEGKAKLAPIVVEHGLFGNVKPLTPDEIEREALRPVPWILKPLILEAGVTLIFATPKAMKSYFGETLAIGIENGVWPVGGFSIEAPYHCAWCTWEDGAQRVSYRGVRSKKQIAPDGLWPDLYPSDRVPGLRLPQHESALSDWIKQHGYKVLFIDVAAAIMDVQDENSAAEVQQFCLSIRRVAVATGCAIVLIHHSNKGSRQKSQIQDRARGSSTLMGLADVVMEMYREGEALKLDTLPKDAPPSSYSIKYDGTSDSPWTVIPEEPGVVQTAPAGRSAAVQKKLGEIAEAIIAIFQETADGVTYTALFKRTGISVRTLKEYVPSLVEDDRARLVTGGGAGHPTKIFPPKGITVQTVQNRANNHAKNTEGGL